MTVPRPQLSAVGDSSCTGKEGGDDSFCAFEFMKGNVSTRLSPCTRVARSAAIWLTWIRRDRWMAYRGQGRRLTSPMLSFDGRTGRLGRYACWPKNRPLSYGLVVLAQGATVYAFGTASFNPG